MKNLAIILSKLSQFSSPKVTLEQYPTDSQIASEVLNFAVLQGDISGKHVMDMGCGSGILGIGAVISRAKKVIFLDIDKEALDIAGKNLLSIRDQFEGGLGEYELICSDIGSFTVHDKIDTVIMNPPFGTRMKHIDVVFLQKAMETADVIYSFHKLETREYIEKFIKKKKFLIKYVWKFKFPLKNTMHMHTRHIKYIDVICFRIEKQQALS